MVRIREEETQGPGGRLRKVRIIEAAHARIEKPDGTVEEYTDIDARESPWNSEGEQSEWRIMGIPMRRILEKGYSLATSTLILLSDDGETILKVGTISIGMQFSSEGGDFLVGRELPLDG